MHLGSFRNGVDAERYICFFTHAFRNVTTPVSFGPAVLERRAPFHHISLYICTRPLPPPSIDSSWDCTDTPTVEGCEEMLYTFSGEAQRSAPPRDVAFRPSALTLVQVHVNGAMHGAVHLLVSPSHAPLVRYMEIGPRLGDDRDLRSEVRGECRCFSDRARAGAMVHYAALHSHARNDRVCLSWGVGREMCYPEHVERNHMYPVGRRLRQNESVHLRCVYQGRAAMGPLLTQQMCFGYLLVEREAHWPYHCWSSPRTCANSRAMDAADQARGL